jgi:hypothetical protein
MGERSDQAGGHHQRARRIASCAHGIEPVDQPRLHEQGRGIAARFRAGQDQHRRAGEQRRRGDAGQIASPPREARGDGNRQRRAQDRKRAQHRHRRVRSDQLDPPAVEHMVVVVVDLAEHAEERIDLPDQHHRPGFVEPQPAARHGDAQRQPDQGKQRDQCPPAGDRLPWGGRGRTHGHDCVGPVRKRQWLPLAGGSSRSPYGPSKEQQPKWPQPA